MTHLANPSDQLHDRDQLAMELAGILGTGRARIQGGHEVAQRLGITQRAVGGVVHRARELGYLIGSAHGTGYYLIQTEGELDDTLAHIRRRVNGLRETERLLTHAWDVRAGDRT